MHHLLRHAVMAMVVVLALLAVGRVSGQEDEFPRYPRSQPEDPWAVEQPPIDATLVILPLVRADGAYEMRRMRAPQFASMHFHANPPLRIVVVDHWTMENVIRSMAPFHREEVVPYDARYAEILQRYFRATHVVESIEERGENGSIVRARMMTIFGEEHAEFPTTADLDVVAGHEMARWIASHMQNHMTFEEHERLGRPLLGRVVEDWMGDDEWQTLMRDTASPKWDEWLATYPDASWVRYRRIDRALAGNRTQLYATLVDPPGDENSSSFYLHGRGRLLRRIGQEETGLHDLEIASALYPGNTSLVHSLVATWADENLIRNRQVSVFEKWHGRMPPAPAWDLVLARVHLNAAESWNRNDAPGTRDSKRAMSRHHNEQAMDLIQRAFLRGGAIPSTLGLAQRATTPTRDTSWFEGYLQQAMQEFPHAIRPYRSVLRSLIRRNTATLTLQQREFIADTLDKNPDWPHVVQLFDDYLFGFDGVIGQLEREGIEGEITGTVLRDWLDKNAEWKELGTRLAHQLARLATNEEEAARALRMAWLVGDMDLYYPIVEVHPRVIFLKNSAYEPAVQTGNVRDGILIALRRTGHTDIALEYTTDLVTNHHECCLDRWGETRTTHYYAHHATFLGLEGRASDADPYWEKAEDSEMWETFRALSWVVSKHRTAEVRETIARRVQEGTMVAELRLAEVFLIAQTRSAEEARAHGESRNLHTRDDYPLLHRLYHQAIGDPIVAMADADE